MKEKVIAIVVLAPIILTSCVVKSLKSFYTKDTLAYDASLLGKWDDGKDRVWEVVPMLETLDSLFSDQKVKAKTLENELKKHSTKSVKVDAKVKVKKNKDLFENKELLKIYKNTYLFIEKEKLSKEDAFFAKKKEENKGTYIVVPFQIKGQVFLDFTLFDDGFYNDFRNMHYIGIHTLAKLDKEGEDFKLSWLSEDVVQELFKQKKIRIKHEKIGLEQKDVLLTASSEELQKFIAKYIDLEQKGKWDGKTLTLKRIK